LRIFVRIILLILIGQVGHLGHDLMQQGFGMSDLMPGDASPATDWTGCLPGKNYSISLLMKREKK
jgi:hypothetical protein